MTVKLRKWTNVVWRSLVVPGTGAEAIPGQVTARLQLAFLVPLLGALLLIVGFWVLALYLHERDMADHEIGEAHSLMERMYHDDLTHHANLLEAVMEVIGRDESLRAAFARHDRGALLQRAAPLFAGLRRKFAITHFYFTRADRVNLLRVHQPDRHGDTIDRFTTLEAGRTGRTAWGVELGPLGTFTLRLVTPWREHGRLVGYVELGMEIDQVLQTIQQFTHMPMFVLVSKDHLKRPDWEAGMKMLGRTPAWDRFPDAVLSVQASETLPPALAERLARGLPPEQMTMLETAPTHAVYRAVLVPLRDAGGRDVARHVGLIDVSTRAAGSHRTIYLGSAIGMIGAAFLFAFFYWLVGRVGQQLERNERRLEELATHDGLTGLYNHRTFYRLLEDELARAKRFNRPVSLLLLDIDHFKRVNDTHGHLAGDAVLKGLSALLSRQSRAIDRVCRYGGEEITIILPETGADAAANIAERLRAAAEKETFDIGDGRTVGITVSIGVATYPQQVDALEKLVTAADTAMYVAKQGGRNRVERYAPSMKGGNSSS
ncbi:MAG: hypothetical protein A2V91_07055 [Candidatus Muproteobacteria bacterium RBG_16_64_10]|uniref:diguanylate cyclase n=1 Tax=Candidatus Muproteobacteria bacterium RBG_16_64_10 TaxID=1817757 RepID=A0A1F6SW65_9PROT|nr:MAG: hypothetical protein A2V91_07055 [Candidatus Muproteobacteria bacterium RBG_16_64_10]